MKKLTTLLAAVLVWSLLPGQPVAAATACFKGPDKTKRGLMTGNVDADDLTDRVWMSRGRVNGRCRWYLVIDSSEHGKIRHRVKPVDDYQRYILRYHSRPVGLVDVDSVPGLEIALQLFQGVAVGGFGLFTLREGVVHRMPATGPGAPLNHVFLYGGSGSGIHATDCAFDKGPDTIVSSSAHPRSYDGPRKWWIVKRRWFQVQDTDLVRTDHPTQKKTVRFNRIAERFDEFGAGPLAGCEGAPH